jgi:hypothetical protein
VQQQFVRIPVLMATTWCIKLFKYDYQEALCKKGIEKSALLSAAAQACKLACQTFTTTLIALLQYNRTLSRSALDNAVPYA